jgi:transaldolase
MTIDVSNLKVKMFADGADLATIKEFTSNPLVAGFTTNPTLMKKAGITDYLAFAKEAIAVVGERPISLEVFADDFENMGRQARIISALGANVYVKIPITNTLQESSIPLISNLAADGVKLNVTAVFTDKQVAQSIEALTGAVPSVISVFAGRIADAGTDPVPAMRKYANQLKAETNIELLWASPREILNLIQASEVGSDIITMTSDLWAKLGNLGKSLEVFSLETVQMFDADAKASGFRL